MGRFAAPRPFLARLRRASAARRAAGAALAATVLGLAVVPAAQAQGPVPQGGEVRVNTYTTDLQFTPRVARSADGGYVVVWSGHEQDGSGGGVFTQRYSADGTLQGGEVQVNTHTTGNQSVPAVAMDADGDYVVVWSGNQQDGDGYGIYARRFGTGGVAQGAEFRVNTTTTGGQVNPAVAVGADGRFVVAWHSTGQDGDGAGVFARRYSAAGAPEGGEVQANTYTTGSQSVPSVAMSADGAFVVAWRSAGQDGSGYGVYARRYDAAGAAQGEEGGVNTTTAGDQTFPSVAMDAGGGAFVVWRSVGEEGGAYARRYSAAGAPEGGEFRVSAVAPAVAFAPAVALDADGDAFVVWTDEDEGGVGVYVRRYDAAGGALGERVRVNTFTPGDQRGAAVAVDADGDATVVWQSFGQDGSGWGVYAQRYHGGGVVAAEPEPDGAADLALVPNPVTGSGVVRYVVPEAAHVRVAVYDVLGREVAVLADREQGAGRYDVALAAGSLAPGTYLVRLTAGEATLVRRVTVAR
ncbi:MAG TPA: T9SS type A sorting domain-containing protein [Rhodothermales bacterium]|nr:T9SS type A sorting domain-containing protein [Rhodothermales bacterium]